MMQPTMFTQPYHPVQIHCRRDWKGDVEYKSRTSRTPKYHFIDYGLSVRYETQDEPHQELPARGGDKSAPEHSDANYDTPCDPFPTDIYYLGNLIRERFIQVRVCTTLVHRLRRFLLTILQTSYGFDFMEPLVVDMVQVDPSKRPSINDVISRFEDIRHSLSSWKLRSRIRHRKEFISASVVGWMLQLSRTIWYTGTHKPAIPDV